MMSRLSRTIMLALVLSGPVLISACSQYGSHLVSSGPEFPADSCSDGSCAVCTAGGECKDHAHVCHNPSVISLAKDLDQLEAHIDWYGSVVATPRISRRLSESR